tara:strand:+ start:1049 stop:1768 length:720 start_codon:yes stop_codon:yes gene_type:complete
MKVVILAGGKGSRISMYTQKIPKPMIKIGNIPMLIHITNIYKHYGFKEFIIAGGYKSRVIKDYLSKNKKYKNIKIVQTGVNSLTGDRIVKLKKYLIKEKNFLLTYGDGVSNVNIIKLLKFHLKHGKIATVTGVRPPLKFGELSIGKNDIVEEFVEKPQLEQGWINGGFFVLNNKIFNYLKGRNITFERTPLEKLCKHKQLKVFKHYDYWMCMDNLNEKNTLDKLFKKFKTIWNFKFKKK